ncbi:phage/plasmid primase, P4 family [Aestuariibaculum lutulentum]|uniref:Phage/plasmid primase, P4 family n=1 Tax=Aestuariibaculum lutulentum TaxID=2920935 RepID=A0ABS9RHI7_9FLAO|nr:phage/plasmid primase, P4 family [Aestuariibaculum lutulentum]MCH4551996.1 phage/plasmid primase, P4 family [Aestuariibaculum lutulentum]
MITFKITHDKESDSDRNQFEACIAQIQKSNIDITTDFKTWVNLGFAISGEFGETGRKYYHQISKCNKQYNEALCDNQYNKCLSYNRTDINISTFYKTVEMHGIKLSIQPKMNDLEVGKHEAELDSLGNSISIINHRWILSELLKQFSPIDFENIANPGAHDNFKISNKHYCVISVDNVLMIAKHNNWDLCKNHSFIYLYNSAYWVEIDKEAFQIFLGQASVIMGVPHLTAKYHKFKKELHEQFLATAYLDVVPNSVDNVLINLKNGTFEISPESSRLRAYNPKDFLTYQLPFEYDAEAKAPIFQQYLDQVLPDKERQNVLAEYLGFVFIKNNNSKLKEEKALILYGSGANGKSVFFEIVRALLGDENVSNYSLQSLTNESGYYRAKISNKLVNYASEINGKLESSIFKQLVSGEPVEARLPYGQPFTLKQYAKLIFNCNELPKEVEQTNAFFRRFLIIPFDVVIPPEEQDKNLHRKIIENELSGVFNWALEGLNRILDQKGFSKCSAAEEAVLDYKKQSDSVKMFVDENNFVVTPNDYTLIKELYQFYRQYCSEDGFKPANKGNFIKRLKDLNIMVERVSGNKLAAFLTKELPK